MPGIFGNAEASTTLKLDTPRTRNFESSTAMVSLSAPIAAVNEA
jgi:hypothetical protein